MATAAAEKKNNIDYDLHRLFTTTHVLSSPPVFDASDPILASHMLPLTEFIAKLFNNVDVPSSSSSLS